MWLITGGVLLFSLMLLGWHNRVRTYTLVGRPNSNQAYLAAGRHGVILLQLPGPEGGARKFRELSRFDTLGRVMDLALRDDLLYVADGDAGLRILRLEEDVLQEVGALSPPNGAGKNLAEVVAVAADRPYVFVGYGTAGVDVVDVSSPEAPKRMSPDGARPLIALPRNSRVFDLGVQGDYLFVAAGETGLLVYDITEPEAPRPILSDNQFDSQKILGFDLAGDGLVALAENTGGVEIAALSFPDAPHSLERERNIGLVRHVRMSYPSAEGDVYWVLAAVEGGGLQILRFVGGEKPDLVPSPSPFPLKQNISDMLFQPGTDLVYIVGEKGAVYALNVASQEYIRRVAEYRVGGGLATQAGFFLGVFALSGVLFFLWMGFFAQFVLPVRTFEERFKVWEYLFYYALGEHGPAIFIESGKKRESRAESLRRGRAVMLLDTASAAVLKTPGEFTRAVGPGVVFLKRNERSAGEVDLHRQTQFIGPKGAGDVFAPQRPGESNDEYQSRLAALEETVGVTRDGIRIAPNIIAVFQLYTEAEDREKWPTRFGYRPESVWRAIVGEGVNLDMPVEALPEKRRMPWNWLPAYLAVDVWRDYVRKFTLEELFQAKYPALDDPEHRLTGMEVLVRQVAMHFSQAQVPALDGFGRYRYGENGDPLMLPSGEFELVRSRGLRVYTIVITNLRLPQVVEEQLLADWQTAWEFQVSNLGGAAERQRIREADKMRMNALVEYALWSSQALYRRLQDTPKPQPDEQETLEIMLEDLRQHITNELNLRRRMTTEWDDWQDLLDWVRMK